MPTSPRPAERPSNRYRAWLEHGAAPPVRGSLAKAQEAAVHYMAGMRLAMRRMGQSGRFWDGLDLFLQSRHAFSSLLALVDNQATVSRRMTPEQVEAWRMRWDDQADRLYARFWKGPAGQQLRRMRPYAAAYGFQRVREVEELVEVMSGNNPAIEAALRRAEAGQKARDRRYAQDCQRAGGPLVLGLVDNLHRDFLRGARQAASARGERGYRFPLGSPQAEIASMEADHPELRRVLWRESSHAPVPTAGVERIRRLRHAFAVSEGYGCYADRQLRTSVFAKPVQIEKTLRQAQSLLAKECQAFRRETFRFLEAQDELRPLADAPWDHSFAVAQTCSPSYKDFRRIFPWRETALKVFGELFGRTGWTATRPARVSGEGVWSAIDFLFENAQGDRAHVFYVPFRPHENEHSYSAGQASIVRNAWAKAGEDRATQVIWIDQCLDKKDQCFDLEGLRVLCHEIGHALHYLSLPGHSPDETTYVPEDLFEIPSYLLELYPRDPAVLARWASRKGPAAAQRSRHWVQRLRWGDDAAIEHQAALRAAQVDLALHTGVDRSFLDISQEALNRCGERMHDEDGSWRRLFLWDETLVCLDYTQITPAGLARRLVTVPDDGRIDAQIVLDTYRSLREGVLAPGISADLVRSAWSRWAGESFAASFKAAVLAHAKQSARITRRATLRLRKKTLQIKKAATAG